MFCQDNCVVDVNFGKCRRQQWCGGVDSGCTKGVIKRREKWKNAKNS